MVRLRGAEDLHHAGQQPVRAGAHVHRLDGQPDRVDPDHFSISRRRRQGLALLFDQHPPTGEELYRARDDLVQHRLQRPIARRGHFDEERFTVGTALPAAREWPGQMATQGTQTPQLS